MPERLIFIWIERLTLIGVVLTVIALLSLPFVRLSSTGAGSHTGYITAVEQEGYLFPNYRVYVKTENSSSQEDKYCLHRDNNNLAQQAKALSQSRSLVEVSFKGVRGIGLGLCDRLEITNISQIN